MMMGTPGRPGMTMTGLVVPAQTAPAVPSKIDSTNPARMTSNPKNINKTNGKAQPKGLSQAAKLRVSLTPMPSRFVNYGRGDIEKLTGDALEAHSEGGFDHRADANRQCATMNSMGCLPATTDRPAASNPL